MPAPTIVAVTTRVPATAADGSVSLSFGEVAGAQAGDLVLVDWAIRSTATALPAAAVPAGMTLEQSQRRGTAGWVTRQSRILTAGDLSLATLYTFGGGATASPGHGAVIHVIRGHHPTAWKHDVLTRSSTSTAFGIGQLTTTVPDCLILRSSATAVGDGTVRTFVWVAGLTEDAETWHGGSPSSSGGGITTAYTLMPEPGTTPTGQTVSLNDGASSVWAGAAIAIAPAVGTVRDPGPLALSGASELAGTGRAIRASGPLALTSDGALAGTGRLRPSPGPLTLSGASGQAGAGTVAGTGTVIVGAPVTLSAEAHLASSPAVRLAGAASLSAQSSMAGEGRLRAATGPLALSAEAGMAGAGTGILGAALELDAEGLLAGLGTLELLAAALELDASAGLAGAGTVRGRVTGEPAGRITATRAGTITRAGGPGSITRTPPGRILTGP